MIKDVIKKVLLLGSGGLSIGQSGEFDYSGSQAIKAMKEEGIFTVLVNPNIATIQTSQGMADKVYLLPVTAEFVEKIIEREKPDGILLGFGGQTALNCGISLFHAGVLQKHGVRVLGTQAKSIIATEDRGLFIKSLNEIGVKTPKSSAAHSVDEAVSASHTIGFPVILRAAYALGGLGSGFCTNSEEVKFAAEKAFAQSAQVLVEESLKGWKEIEYEVVRDSLGNCITVCNMENIDPLGIHTGDSIVVAPSQTLSDKEYHNLRKISIKVIEHLAIVGECNIQFALDPSSEDYRVIEVNARLSRSSALASKATGYPLAYVAAKLSIGVNLKDIINPITKKTTAFFEPALDYVAVKFPRWDVEKFRMANPELGSSMKSIGEVMGIGRNFEEALQKAVRMSKDAYLGLVDENIVFEDIDYELSNPSFKRLFAVARKLQEGMSIEKLYHLTSISPWFLSRIEHIVRLDKELSSYSMETLPEDFLRLLKKTGFSDKHIAKRFHLGGEGELMIRSHRKRLGIIPVVKQIDTLAAEFPAKTNYLYVTYNGEVDDVSFESQHVMVLGSGAYSIGSSVEFDWCSVKCVQSLRRMGYKTAVINFNPETVSTDYDESDRLYFDELSFERVMDICDKEPLLGVIVSFGGQIPNTLAPALSSKGIKIFGTSPVHIDTAENRHKFSLLLDSLTLDQPRWKELTSIQNIKAFALEVGYPVLIRPSYVLSGASMSVAFEEEDLDNLLKKASMVSGEFPVVVTKFMNNAKEIEMDAVAKDGEIIAYAISEHVENAGVHSGDATLVTPPQKLYLETMRMVRKASIKLIRALCVTGPVNIQYLAKDNSIKIIECNVRASRTFPFVSKVYKVDFVDLATRAMMGEDVCQVKNSSFEIGFVGVKAPQFSFTRLHGADPILGVEMASTGEVACLGEHMYEAFLKAMLSAGFKTPLRSILLSTGSVEEKTKFLKYARLLDENGFSLYATKGTSDFYAQHGIRTSVLYWPLEDKEPNVLDFIKKKKIDLVINIPKNNEKSELSNDYKIRRTAADFSIPLITNLQCSILLVKSICQLDKNDLKILAMDEYS